MERDPRTYIWDARRAAELIGTFVAERSWDDYRADAMLRSVVERQFEIVGEALNNLRQTDATLAEQITDLSRIIAFSGQFAKRSKYQQLQPGDAYATGFKLFYDEDTNLFSPEVMELDPPPDLVT